jgi:hypothetical protein
MNEEISPAGNRQGNFLRSGEAGAYLKIGSMWYGFIFGLSYALILWGWYAYQIWRNSMMMPWLEIFSGIVLVVVIWVLMGYLSSTKRSVGWVILLGAITAGITPWLVWLAKTIGENAVWFMDRQNWSFVTHLGEALRYRLFFVSLWGIGFGVVAGLLGRWLIPHAWDLTTASGRTSFKSVALFLLCLPLTVLFGSVSNDLIHKDFFESLTGIYEGFSTLDQDETRRPFVTWRYDDKPVESHLSWEWPSGDFTLYLVDYHADTMDLFFFDAVFPGEPTVRCQGGTSSLALCGNVSDTFWQLMDRMIQAGLNRRLGDLQCETCDPSIRSQLLISLDQLRPNFTQEYDIYKSYQRGGAISMTAHFNQGFELTCNFRGEDPILVESCLGDFLPQE